MKLRDLLIESFDTPGGQFMGSRAIRARVQIEKLLDLFKGEPSLLRLPDEVQPPKIVRAIAADAPVARWRAEKSATLVETDRLHPHPSSLREATDRKSLTLYHGTEPI